MSDDQLLEAHQKRRNLKAFHVLYNRMSPKLRAWVWTFSRRYGFGRSEADDVYSDVTLRILKSTRAYDPALGNASCYLYGLTRHAVFSFLKNKTRHRVRLLGGADSKDRRPAEGELPDVVHALRKGLARLDSRGRKIMLLRVDEGRSLKEIASALEMTVPQARACYHRAVGELRQMIANIPTRHGLSRRKCPLRRGKSIDEQEKGVSDHSVPRASVPQWKRR